MLGYLCKYYAIWYKGHEHLCILAWISSWNESPTYTKEQLYNIRESKQVLWKSLQKSELFLGNHRGLAKYAELMICGYDIPDEQRKPELAWDLRMLVKEVLEQG